MATKGSKSYNEGSTDLTSVSRRLSALAMEEEEIESSPDCDMSETSTVASARIHQKGDKSPPGLPTPDDAETSGWSSSMSGAATPSPVDYNRLVRNDSQIMQVKKVTKTRWTTFPVKGYKTTTKFFYEEIDGHWTAALIVLCFFTAGLVDSVSYSVFGVFTSLQTGNTVLCALRLSNQPIHRHRFDYIKSVTSIASYCLGGLFFNVLHRAPTDISNPRPRLHRWTLFVSFIVQSSLVTIAAALSQSGWTSTAPSQFGSFSSSSERNPEGENNYLDLLPISFLAFEAAGQVCLSRVLVINELPTIVVSTLYHDFIADALSWRQLWKERKSTWDFVESQKRQIRRICCILALFAGSTIGGFVYATPGRIAAALWIAAGLKIMVSFTWCVWKRKVVTETIVTTEAATATPR